MKRILSCYACDLVFSVEESKANAISIGKHKAYCDKCWKEYKMFELQTKFKR